nr:MAG TPA: hypothetical protein [Caudoviricetes sp.]
MNKNYHQTVIHSVRNSDTHTYSRCIQAVLVVDCKKQ